MRKLELWVIVCVPPLVCAGVAVGMGLDANWDLRNHHYYNAYAFLTDRQALDAPPSTSAAPASSVHAGRAPLSSIIPAFPPAVRFVRPEGNLDLRPEDGFSREIAAILAQSDKVFVVYLDGDAVNLSHSLARWGLSWPKPQCLRLDTNVPDNLVVCRASADAVP